MIHNMSSLGGLESLPRFWSVSPGLMSFLEEALVSTEKLTNPNEVQSEPHFPSDVVLGQLVTERIGLENGIVLSSQVNLRGSQALFAHGWFLEPTPSAPQMWEHCRWWLNQLTDSVSLSLPLWTCIVADESTNSNVSFLIPHSPRTLLVLTFHIHVTTCVFTNSSSPQDCLL